MFSYARKQFRHLPVTGVFLVLAIGAILVLAYVDRFRLQEFYEDVTLLTHPNAQLAYTYGVRHFDGTSPQEYDIERAQRLFQTTLKYDPNFPMANHELARIAFLKGDFLRALSFMNVEFKVNPHPSPSSYYVRALIEGYMQDYSAAAADYEAYFKVAPANWAGINDYSWVLLKMNLPQAAHDALNWGLKQWPNNAWLLANDATALYELGRFKDAKAVAVKAQTEVAKLTTADWLIAYPGNDPLLAPAGLAAFKQSAQENLSKILAAE